MNNVCKVIPDTLLYIGGTCEFNNKKVACSKGCVDCNCVSNTITTCIKA